MAQIGDIIEKQYKILKEIGRGGTSIVYLVEDIQDSLRQQWAMKEIRKEIHKEDDAKQKVQAKRAIAEAYLLKELQYSAFPLVSGIKRHKDIDYVIMEYVNGDSLDKILHREKKLSEEKVVFWAQEICKALSNLHSKNIIYNDMKPGNVMLTKENQIKIIDFGTAQKYEPNKRAPGYTQGFAAPELLTGTMSARSDIYALGMTMHRLLTGRNPPKFEKKEVYVPVRQWRPELSEGIEIVINKCVQKNPDDRYQSCEELLQDLNSLEKLTQEYWRRLFRKRNWFIGSLIFSIVMLVSCCGCYWSATEMNSNTYKNLVASQAETLEGKIAEYKQAITIAPEKTDAYIRILDAYVAEGKFGREEHAQFITIYNNNKDKLDKSSVEVAELNYKIGEMYFNYYKEQDGTYSFSERIQKAHPFFEANYEEASEEFKLKKLSDCYYYICDFYKEYILNSESIKEASKENYEELLHVVQEAMEDVKIESQYEQLVLYNGTMLFLYDQRASMASVNVELDDILTLMDEIERKTEALSVNKTLSIALRKEILDNCKDYKEAIHRVYMNTAERS